ncbi:RNA 3'-terminal phosphate cyclase [uncultured Paraglaciecola sp.]|uniref:RNA 3'-terminal phosphate cyclase n=1 Tax=uncultured Paraglaciecola sp. TaxID=1765024 RepID=UPI002599B9F4|nr:RNA 3'-terminal phosphate cyclase [uncultured Paraglaciecola sp.]
MSYLTIDGSQGEGGGQVLRTALTLSILTQQCVELINIRAGRKKAGLLRQHLTCVLAAQEICGATTEGVELGSTRILFSPGQVKSGDYHYAIGTAGSTVLVCQTIFPVLALAKGNSTITFEGGTHNGMSPSLSFFEHSFLPLLKSMGVNGVVNIFSLGFYPAGGGKWQIKIEPTNKLAPIYLTEAGCNFAKLSQNCSVQALVSLLPENIGQREVDTAKKILNWPDALSEVQSVVTTGPGNSLQLGIKTDTHRNIFELVGELGVSAERVAKRAAGRVNKFIHAEAAVEEHLADQLLVPIALAGVGSFTTTKPSLHTTTNIEVIKLVLGVEIQTKQLSDVLWKVYLEK